MKFLTFIDNTGVPALASMLRHTEAAIYQWRTAKAAPRPETAFILTVLSRGELTLDDIFQPYIERRLQGTTFDVQMPGGKQGFVINFNFEKSNG